MRPKIDLTLYLVLDPALCGSEEGMLETACQAAEAGATCVQLRAPGWSTGRLVSLARRIKSRLEPLRVPLIVNNDIVATLLSGAQGVHLGQSDASPRLARDILGEDALIGLSITCYEELGTLDPRVVDYAGIGPVFSTRTKPDAAAAMGLDAFERTARACPVPCVAIGGIGLQNVSSLANRATSGIAVVSAICGQSDIASSTRELKSRFL